MGRKGIGVLVLAGLSTFGISCAPQPELEAARRDRAQSLTRTIVGMDPSTGRGDAEEFATQAVELASRQREEWGVVLTPWLHNGLVNLGLKPAGLCYEWANSLHLQLHENVPPDLKMTLVKSNPGSMREHHAISLHQRKRPWSDGILLDAWEKAGILVHMPIQESERNWEYEAEKPYYKRPSLTTHLPAPTSY